MDILIIYLFSVALTIKVWQIALEKEPLKVTHLVWVCFIPFTNIIVLIIGIAAILFPERLFKSK